MFLLQVRRLLLRALLCALLFVPAMLASCIPDGSLGSGPPARATSPVSRDINKLGQSIALPRRPLSAAWRIERIGDGELGPSDFVLTAAMQFSPRDLKAVLASAIKRAPAKPDSVLPWFPDALKQKAAKSKGRLKAQSMDASDFYKLSYIQGSLHRIEGTNSLVVSLHTS